MWLLPHLVEAVFLAKNPIDINTDEFQPPDLPDLPQFIEGKTLSANIRLLIVAFFASIGGLLYGYDTGIISGALLQITIEWHLTTAMVEVITTSILIGAVFGAFISGRSSKKYGRRITVFIIALVFFFGVLAASLSPSPWFLVTSRLFLGLAVGGSSQIIPTYIAEVTPADKRGRMVTMFNISIGIGILSASLVTQVFSSYSWRLIMGAACIPAGVLALGMLKLPETPRWLIEKGEVSEARQVLFGLRYDRKSAVKEAQDIIDKRQIVSEKADGETTTLGSKWLRPALIAGLGVAAFTQISGLEMMIYYAPTILTGTDFGADFALWTSVGIAWTYLIFTIIGESFVDSLGRRTLMLMTVPGCAVSLFAFGSVFATSHEPNGMFILLLLFFYMAFNAGGLQIVGWLVGSEVYPHAIRDTATSLHAATLWGANILATSTCLTCVKYMGMAGTMWMYAVFNLLGWFYILFLVPETKERSLEEIEDSLHTENFYPYPRVIAKWKRLPQTMREIYAKILSQRNVMYRKYHELKLRLKDIGKNHKN